MARDTGVFLPDEAESQIQKKAPQSARVNSDHANRVESASAAQTDLAKLSEQELKSAIIAAWKKHQELAKKDLAPMLYWLREKLGAQGARNDLTHKGHRGWEIWVTEHLDISRATADRWCAWYAKENGLVPAEPTSTHVSGSDLELYEDILNTHKGKQQIAFNCWVPTALHAQYQKALTALQKKFGLKDKKEALVRGVIYAASVVDKGAAKKVLGHVPLRGPRSKNAGSRQLRARNRAAAAGR